MSNRVRNLLTALALLAPWLVLGFATDSEYCEKTEDGKEKCTRSYSALVLFWKVAKAFEDYDGAITAASTVVIAVLTVLLWFSTHKMWEEAKLSRDAARDAFNESHFPRIEVRRIRLRNEPKAQGILFVIANIGNGTAYKITANLNHWLGHSSAVTHQLKRECMPPYGNTSVDLSAAINKPGLAGRPELLPRMRTFHFYPVPDLNALWVGRFLKGEATIVFYGYIDFSDASGQRRGMGFFRTLKDGRFWPEENDPDYEWN